jgi:hypothetical protein
VSLIAADLEFDAPPESAADLMRGIRAAVAVIQAREHAEADASAQRKQDRRDREAAKRAAELARVESALAADPDDIPSIGYDLLMDSDHPVAVEIRRRRAAAEARKKSAEVAVERAKVDAIEAWVAASGNDLLRQQYADGLLARKAVVALMAAEALDAAGLPATCTEPEVCDDMECPCGGEVVATIPPEIYAQWKTIGPLPGGSTAEFHRLRRCLGAGDGSAGPVEYHTIVTVPSGPFRFTRRIALVEALEALPLATFDAALDRAKGNPDAS